MAVESPPTSRCILPQTALVYGSQDDGGSGLGSTASWVRRLMPIGGLAIYRKPNTSKPAPEHRIYPYLSSGSNSRQGPSGLQPTWSHVPGIPFDVASYGLAQRAGLECSPILWRWASVIAALKVEALSKGQPEIFNTDPAKMVDAVQAFCRLHSRWILSLGWGFGQLVLCRGHGCGGVVKAEEVSLKAYRSTQGKF